MITRPDLTDEQKAEFVAQFNAIMKAAPDELQKIWPIYEGITWVGNIPHFSGNMHLKLKEKQQSQYEALKRKLDNRLL